ncbi:hypothetical protein P4U65_14515 [Bacillus pacificus]|nr:hypothetical protein [Bacillus pacificus]
MALPTFHMEQDSTGGLTLTYTTSFGRSSSTYFNAPPSSIDHVCIDYMKGRFNNIQTWSQVDFIKQQYKKEYTRIQAENVLNKVKEFMITNKITCEETIHQSDRVIENAYGFIEDLYNLVEDSLPFEE